MSEEREQRAPAPKGAWSPGLTEALRLLRQAEQRPPTPADAPPVSTFPRTKAATAALRYAREEAKRAGDDAERRRRSGK